jgi:hypothetical protein
MRLKQKWHPIWGYRERTKYHTSLVRGGKHPFVHDICCGEDNFTDTVPFRLENRPQTAWQGGGGGGVERSPAQDGASGVDADMVLEDVDDAHETDKKASFMGVPFMENQMSR